MKRFLIIFLMLFLIVFIIETTSKKIGEKQKEVKQKSNYNRINIQRVTQIDGYQIIQIECGCKYIFFWQKYDGDCLGFTLYEGCFKHNINK